MRGAYRVLSHAEIAEYLQRALDEGNSSVLPLLYTIQSREGTLRRLYGAVIATPLEGTELREAMKEAELTLGIT